MNIKKPSLAVLVCMLVCNPAVNLLGRCMSFIFLYKVEKTKHPFPRTVFYCCTTFIFVRFKFLVHMPGVIIVKMEQEKFNFVLCLEESRSDASDQAAGCWVIY